MNALLSGMDLVYVSDFSSLDQPDNFTAAIETFNYLTQKYREDPAFAERVDEAVMNILALKYRLYGNFTPSRVFPSNANIVIQPGSNEVVFEIARNSATLVNPDQADLDQVLPDPPKRTDRIVFITDTRNYEQCSECQTETILAKDSLQNTVLRRYGPTAGRQVVSSNLSSFTMADLEQLLNNQETSAELQRKLALSHWIVFSMLDKSDDHPSYDTLSRFLARRPDLFKGKKSYYLLSTHLITWMRPTYRKLQHFIVYIIKHRRRLMSLHTCYFMSFQRLEHYRSPCLELVTI